MQKVAGSFRDPSGFVFKDAKSLKRSIAPSYFSSYDHLMGSGLYDSLVQKKLLIPHHEELQLWTEQERIITPNFVPVISYPCEWSFSQLKDAALLTVDIQKEALSYGMSLKDASAYNVQFYNGRPIFIDTLSFEPYKEGAPWVAYKQFCEHFLAPLALMAYTDIRLSCLGKQYLDGIPVSLASKLLPFKTYTKLSLLVHIHLHARAQKKFESKTDVKSNRSHFSKNQLLGLLDSLESGIKGCSYNAAGTEWADYYQDDSYTPAGFASKKQIVEDFLRLAQPTSVADLGANDGTFSNLAAQYSDLVLSMDYDVACVEKNYLRVKATNNHKLLPLVVDLMNPTGAFGWGSIERQALTDRVQVECVMALALIHHLAISNNVPLDYIASYFTKLTTQWLIIEFVPKVDKKVKTLLATRTDIFNEYTQEHFEQIFSRQYSIVAKEKIAESDRILYLMKANR